MQIRTEFLNLISIRMSDQPLSADTRKPSEKRVRHATRRPEVGIKSLQSHAPGRSPHQSRSLIDTSSVSSRFVRKQTPHTVIQISPNDIPVTHGSGNRGRNINEVPCQEHSFPSPTNSIACIRLHCAIVSSCRDDSCGWPSPGGSIKNNPAIEFGDGAIRQSGRYIDGNSRYRQWEHEANIFLLLATPEHDKYAVKQ